MMHPQDARLLAECTAHHITAPMPRGRDTLHYTTVPDNLDSTVIDGKKHVVFASYYPNVTAIKTSWALRKSGNYYTTLIACCIREDAHVEEFFDQCYEVVDYADMQALLLCCTPHILHTYIQPSIVGALAVTCGAQTGTSVVVHINDAVLFVEKDSASHGCQLEAALLRCAAAFTHKMPLPAVQELRLAYALDSPDACIHALPVPDFCTQPRPCADPTEALHLVFAGGVMPYHLAMQRGHENHVLDPLIEQCCGKGHALTVLINVNARNMFWHEHEHYFALQNRYPAFRFEQGTALQHVAARIAGHTCGIHYENRPICSYNPKHFEYNMATKIFTYIEAGLPVMVSDSAPYIVSFIEEHGLGFGFSFDRFADALTTMRHFDHHAHCKNHTHFVRHHSMLTMLPLLTDLYGAAHA